MKQMLLSGVDNVNVVEDGFLRGPQAAPLALEWNKLGMLSLRHPLLCHDLRKNRLEDFADIDHL